MLDRNRDPGKYRSGLSLIQVLCLLGVLAAWAKPVYHFAQRAKGKWQAEYLWEKRSATLNDAKIGDPVAWIRCEKAKLDTLVLLGDTPENLMKYPSLAWLIPDDSDLMVILGHRDAHFRHLNDLDLGDHLSIQLAGSPHHTPYAVEYTEILDPADVQEVIAQTKEEFHNRLVLITCYPFDFIGPAPKRYLVWLARIPQKPLACGAHPPELPKKQGNE